MSEPQCSNWRDATNVAMPRCPKCGEVNQPGQYPMIELVGKVYVCNVCATEWKPIDPAA